MKHANISVFIPHKGCPNACSFCDQRVISKTAHAPSPDEAEDIIRGAYGYMIAEKRKDTEIAFFGGSFTAIDRDYMTSLLERAEKYLGEDNGGFRGIRISTRPDCIDEEILMLLKRHGVTAIELGAQSMKDEVLRLNSRGHTADHVRKASEIIKAHGFELGLQMMTGLYGSAPEDDIFTADELIKLSPCTARIYPTVILEGTKLAELFGSGEYVLYPFDTAVKVCARIYKSFVQNGIHVIRLGLHAEEGVAERCVAGYYHPAFGELVRSEIIKELILSDSSGKKLCEANNRLISSLVGHKGSNREFFADKNVSLGLCNDVPDGCVRINGRDINIYTDQGTV